jgi:xylose isomerase
MAAGNWRLSANAVYFGLRRDRFTQYQPARSLDERLALIAAIDGLDGVELKYPADFADPTLVRRLLEQHELVLSALNVDLKDAAYFRHGALSAADAEARHRAVGLLREAMDIAADFAVDLVTTCPLTDAYDYPFQLDYVAAWGRFIESVRAAVGHRPDVKLCLEYLPHDPHARIMLGNVGKLLHVCAEVGAPNLGANLDVGHAFAALESPAESAALLAASGRLFYLHTNDNTGDGGDWDMISGSIHFWDWIELLYTLDRVGYVGWLGADIAVKHFEPTAAYAANVRMLQGMTALLRRLDPATIAGLVSEPGSVAAIFAHLGSLLTSGTTIGPGKGDDSERLVADP